MSPSRSSGAAAAAVDKARLWQRHMDMAAIGALPRGGVNRPALSADDGRARRQLVDWAVGLGFTAATDPIGNLFIRRAGRRDDSAPVLTGSHLDTQPTGGKFDGAFGVLAGLEALQALNDAGIETERPIELVAWTNGKDRVFSPAAPAHPSLPAP
jgi:N-carbamoyl-L-amino-acid hydrolase